MWGGIIFSVPDQKSRPSHLLRPYLHAKPQNSSIHPDFGQRRQRSLLTLMTAFHCTTQNIRIVLMQNNNNHLHINISFCLHSDTSVVCSTNHLKHKIVLSKLFWKLRYVSLSVYSASRLMKPPVLRESIAWNIFCSWLFTEKHKSTGHT